MASRYIPPHLRNKPVSSQDEATSTTANTDSSHRPQRPLQDLAVSAANEDLGYSVDEIAAHYNHHQHLGVNYKASTLHSSVTKPDDLVYVLLFRNANPRWETDQIIFAKTNLHILPGYNVFKASINGKNNTSQPEGATAFLNSLENLSLGASDEHHHTQTSESPAKSSAQTLPPRKDLPSYSKDSTQNHKDENDTARLIPVFSEVSSRRFTFTGYFRILNIEFLAPGSAALIRMLEQKWALTHNNGRAEQKTGTKYRNPEKWAESLGVEWAVVKMGKVERGDLQEPKIAKVEVM